ncbi:MAG: ribonuclease H-like domain-containing protein [Deltaproteobacteria bacterium]|nr:ribonuclease H-like domain-containing protein [Deltaproteobacteria bacterium]
MDLQRKLSRLRPRRDPAAEPAAPEPAAPEPVAPPEPPPGESVFEALRAQLQRRRGRLARASVGADVALFHDDAPWPFAPTDSEHGTLHRSHTRLDPAAKHGAVPVQRALAARGPALSTLALDPSLAELDVGRALFLDTETTGLSGGTGTIAFLVGVAYFDDDELVVEQLFVHDPDAEAAMLSRVAALVAGASALITFNGKSFDLPLLRSRFVLSRIPPPALPPHLDLLHVARRIYGARVDRCSLTGLERDVLRFERLDDIAGEEIPERYRRYLREGDRAGIVPVVRHNLWDLVALAALTGELGPRGALPLGGALRGRRPRGARSYVTPRGRPPGRARPCGRRALSRPGRRLARGAPHRGEGAPQDRGRPGEVRSAARGAGPRARGRGHPPGAGALL